MTLILTNMAERKRDLLPVTHIEIRTLLKNKLKLLHTELVQKLTPDMNNNVQYNLCYYDIDPDIGNGSVLSNYRA